MTSPRVSVVLPAYNAAAYIEEAVSSILTQTEPDFELIVIDDGSDAPITLPSDRRIRLIRTPHRGLVAALNHGLAEARAPYVARMDADDIAHVKRLALQSDFLDAHPDVGLVASQVRYLGDREANRGLALFVDWTNTLLTPESIAFNRFIESPVIHPSVMFRRELTAQQGDYRDGAFPEDYELWLRWLEAGVGFSKLPEELLDWRDRPDRLTRADDRYSTAAFFRTKAPYLFRWLAANNPRHPRLHIWGAGRPTRLRLAPLLDLGVEVAAWVDIDPKKIGQRIGATPVIAPEDLPAPGDAFVLAAVASRGARDLIAGRLSTAGYVAGNDWIACA